MALDATDLKEVSSILDSKLEAVLLKISSLSAPAASTATATTAPRKSNEFLDENGYASGVTMPLVMPEELALCVGFRAKSVREHFASVSGFLQKGQNRNQAGSDYQFKLRDYLQQFMHVPGWGRVGDQNLAIIEGEMVRYAYEAGKEREAALRCPQ